MGQDGPWGLTCAGQMPPAMLSHRLVTGDTVGDSCLHAAQGLSANYHSVVEAPKRQCSLWGVQDTLIVLELYGTQLHLWGVAHRS